MLCTKQPIDSLNQAIQQENFTSDIFDSAYSQIYDTLKYDSFPRYLKYLVNRPIPIPIKVVNSAWTTITK